MGICSMDGGMQIRHNKLYRLGESTLRLSPIGTSTEEAETDFIIQENGGRRVVGDSDVDLGSYIDRIIQSDRRIPSQSTGHRNSGEEYHKRGLDCVRSCADLKCLTDIRVLPSSHPRSPFAPVFDTRWADAHRKGTFRVHQNPSRSPQHKALAKKSIRRER